MKKYFFKFVLVSIVISSCKRLPQSEIASSVSTTTTTEISYEVKEATGSFLLFAENMRILRYETEIFELENSGGTQSNGSAVFTTKPVRFKEFVALKVVSTAGDSEICYRNVRESEKFNTIAVKCATLTTICGSDINIAQSSSSMFNNLNISGCKCPNNKVVPMVDIINYPEPRNVCDGSLGGDGVLISRNLEFRDQALTLEQGLEFCLSLGAGVLLLNRAESNSPVSGCLCGTEEVFFDGYFNGKNFLLERFRPACKENVGPAASNTPAPVPSGPK